MKKNARIVLERERIKLKIKQQEYEIKKNLLDLKHKYHPFNIALHAAGDYLSGRNAAEMEVMPDAPKSEHTNSRRALHTGSFGQLIAQIIGLIQNYFQLADNINAANDAPEAGVSRKEEQYIIGKDDR